MSLRAAGSALAAALVAVSVWFGQAPPRTAGAYQDRAEQAAAYLLSQVRTAGLWVQAVGDGRATHQAATVAIREAESDAGATSATFAAWDPPPGTERLRDDVTGVADDVTSALATLRIAVNQGRWAALPATARPLPPLQSRLSDLLQRLRGGSG